MTHLTINDLVKGTDQRTGRVGKAWARLSLVGGAEDLLSVVPRAHCDKSLA